MILSIGEILFDVFPAYRRLGGAPFNFAYHLKHLGFAVRFTSRVGCDDAGREILDRLDVSEFNIGDMQIDPTHPTGTVNVELDVQGSPAFDITRDVAYDYLDFSPDLASVLATPPRLMYFGTLIQRTTVGRNTLREIFAAKSPQTRCLYDINLRPGCFHRDLITESLEHADILKLNMEELSLLKNIFSYTGSCVLFCNHLMERFHLSMICVTRGANGSELYIGKNRYTTTAAGFPSVTDTVGAGDAYTAMLAVGLLSGWSPQRVLSEASRFAARICLIEGAVPTEPNFYDEFIHLIKGEL